MVVDYSPKSSASSLSRSKHGRKKSDVEVVREYERERYIPVDPPQEHDRVAAYHVEGSRSGRDRRSVGGSNVGSRRADARASTGSYRSVKEHRETFDEYGRSRRGYYD